MLTQQEENVLRKLARDITPPVVQNPQTVPDHSSIWNYIRRVLKTAAPPVIVSGHPGDATREGIPLKVIGEDEELLKLSAPFRKKHESLNEFYARTLIGAHDLRTLDADELARRVELVEEQNREAGMRFEPTPKDRRGRPVASQPKLSLILTGQ